MRRMFRIRFKTVIIFVAILVVILFVSDQAVLRLYPLKYGDLVQSYSERFNVDPFLVLAIIKAESNFKPGAVSPKNARGLMQISEGTGKWGAGRLNLKDYTSEKLFEPEINIYIGCWYLSVLYDEFGDSDLVIAAYNGGSGNVTQWLNDRDLSADGKTLDRIPFRETDQYLKKVNNYYSIYKRLYESQF